MGGKWEGHIWVRLLALALLAGCLYLYFTTGG